MEAKKCHYKISGSHSDPLPSLSVLSLRHQTKNGAYIIKESQLFLHSVLPVLLPAQWSVLYCLWHCRGCILQLQRLCFPHIYATVIY
jgi:hypothetical protein